VEKDFVPSSVFECSRRNEVVFFTACLHWLWWPGISWNSVIHNLFLVRTVIIMANTAITSLSGVVKHLPWNSVCDHLLYSPEWLRICRFFSFHFFWTETYNLNTCSICISTSIWSHHISIFCHKQLNASPSHDRKRSKQKQETGKLPIRGLEACFVNWCIPSFLVFILTWSNSFQVSVCPFYIMKIVMTNFFKFIVLQKNQHILSVPSLWTWWRLMINPSIFMTPFLSSSRCCIYDIWPKLLLLSHQNVVWP
jgi:hypothetical protein